MLYIQKGKVVKSVSHVALVKMESQTANDSAYLKDQPQLTLILQSQLELTSHKQSHAQFDTLFYQSHMEGTAGTFTFI